MGEYILNLSNNISRKFVKLETDKDKLLVFCVAKNEDNYIKEFIDHYINIGFDKVVICDNNDDNTILPNLLESYIKSDIVQIFDFSGLKHFQVDAYNMFANGGNFKWCGFFDCDEFIALNERYNNISDFLNEIESDCDCVLLNWMMYGCNENEYKTDGNIQDRFTTPILPLMMAENFFVKSIIRGGKPSLFYNMHIGKSDKYCFGGLYYDDGKKLDTGHVSPPIYQKAYLKHFYTKSLEEFNDKIGRNWPDYSDVNKRNNLMASSMYYPNYKQLPIEMNSGILFGHKIKRDVIKEFDVFVFCNVKYLYYSLLIYVCDLMRQTKGYIYIIPDDINESIYMLLLGYAIETNNRIFTYKNDENQKAFFSYVTQKYGKVNNEYYFSYTF